MGFPSNFNQFKGYQCESSEMGFPCYFYDQLKVNWNQLKFNMKVNWNQLKVTSNQLNDRDPQ